MGAAILKIVRRLDTSIYLYVDFVREQEFQITFGALFSEEMQEKSKIHHQSGQFT